MRFNHSIKIYVALALVLTVYYIRDTFQKCSDKTLNTRVINYRATPVNSERGIVSGNKFKGDVIRESLINSLPPSNYRVQTECSIGLVGVTTTIKSSAECIRETSKYMKVVVIGDEGSVGAYSDEINSQNIEFLGLELQAELYPALSSALPNRSFSRKNIGIAHAILAMSACTVWDFDDDNCPTDATAALFRRVMDERGLQNHRAAFWLTSESLVVNPYLLFGSSDFIWPRGYPLDLIEKKEIPRIVRISDTVDLNMDVIQVIQDVDPDVDAIWRLQNGVHDFKWKSSSAIKDSIIGIHPSKFTPFNAQATLISRSAAALAYLPWTIHGRVSDIWRSYIMQYLLSKMNGAIGFSSASVNHFRNSHDYMADHDAELQLYAQTSALARYLDKRQPKNCSMREEYVALMDDLYIRGFVEHGDVHTASIWADFMIEKVEISCNNATGESEISIFPALVSKKNVIAVLHINHDFLQNVPIWMSLHSHKFHSVDVYLPKSSNCRPIGGINIHCLSDDSIGYVAYESVVHSINKNSIWKIPAEQVDGFLFIHDDMIWKSDLEFGPQQSMITEYLPLYENMPNWGWGSTEWGFPALRRLESKYGNAITAHPFYGQADFYYVSIQDAANFATTGAKMKEMNVFLEIAVPMIFNSGCPENKIIKLYTDWYERRHDLSETQRQFCSQNYDIAHPVKLSTIQGILGHIAC